MEEKENAEKGKVQDSVRLESYVTKGTDVYELYSVNVH